VARGKGEAIREGDARSMLRFVGDLASLEEPEEFRAGILPGLRELVPCEIAAYNEIHFETNSLVALTDPADAVPQSGVEAFIRLGQQNPLIQRYERTRDGRPYKWSDMITRRELHASELYRLLYAPIGVEYQMAMVLPSPAEEIIGLTVNRGKRDFSERDRGVLNLVRAPLIQAYRLVDRYAALARRLEAAERGLERRGIGVVLLDGQARRGAAFASGDARQALGLASGEGPAELPEQVSEWLREQPGGDPATPLGVLAADGGRAVVHFMPARKDGDTDALLIERAKELLSLEDLRSAGLTGRQAEVLRLVALGRGTAEIADELTVSERTVHKHLENIYDRLGASSRTQAVLTAWSLSRGGDRPEG
jgi:DNA-binding CsgD family transcriptional regulator